MPQTQSRRDRCQVWVTRLILAMGGVIGLLFIARRRQTQSPVNLYKGRLEKVATYTQHVVHVMMGIGGHLAS